MSGNRFSGLINAARQPEEELDVQTSQHLNAQASEHSEAPTSEALETSNEPPLKTAKTPKSKRQTKKKAKANTSPQQTKTSKHLNVQTSEHSESQTSEPLKALMAERVAKKSNSGKIAKSADPNYVRTTLYLPKILHRKLKIKSLEADQEMSEIVEELIADWLSKDQ